MTCPYCNTNGGESAYHPGTCANCGATLPQDNQPHPAERVVEFWGNDKLLAVTRIPNLEFTRDTFTAIAKRGIARGEVVFAEDVET